ncbi:MAG TPA: Lrp/AsnC family transcriptional regulator [Fervidobacterium sp.]|jgi:DNA-binding Lrp family transcriptional regulator|nr:Lrp/AsnC family transcriptional regulator [Fervidobacterium sp.]
MEKELLGLIEHNAKMTVEEIAEELVADPNEVVSLIAELETKKVICGYDTIINWDKVTEEKCNALIEVKVTPQRGTGFDRIAERISKFDEVDSVYLMSGTYDFMVIINGRSMKEVSSFVFEKISAIDFIQSTATHFVLKKYKDHGVSMADKPIAKRTNIVL